MYISTLGGVRLVQFLLLSGRDERSYRSKSSVVQSFYTFNVGPYSVSLQPVQLYTGTQVYTFKQVIDILRLGLLSSNTDTTTMNDSRAMVILVIINPVR